MTRSRRCLLRGDAGAGQRVVARRTDGRGDSLYQEGLLWMSRQAQFRAECGVELLEKDAGFLT